MASSANPTCFLDHEDLFDSTYNPSLVLDTSLWKAVGNEDEGLGKHPEEPLHPPQPQEPPDESHQHQHLVQLQPVVEDEPFQADQSQIQLTSTEAVPFATTAFDLNDNTDLFCNPSEVLVNCKASFGSEDTDPIFLNQSTVEVADLGLCTSVTSSSTSVVTASSTTDFQDLSFATLEPFSQISSTSDPQRNDSQVTMLHHFPLTSPNGSAAIEANHESMALTSLRSTSHPEEQKHDPECITAESWETRHFGSPTHEYAARSATFPTSVAQSFPHAGHCYGIDPGTSTWPNSGIATIDEANTHGHDHVSPESAWSLYQGQNNLGQFSPGQAFFPSSPTQFGTYGHVQDLGYYSSMTVRDHMVAPEGMIIPDTKEGVKESGDTPAFGMVAKASQGPLSSRSATLFESSSRFKSDTSPRVYSPIEVDKSVYGSPDIVASRSSLCQSRGQRLTHPNSPDSSTDTTKNVCGICGKTYARPSTLKTHLRTHSGERPYRCYSCNKSFSQAANLTAHCRTHSGEKPFHCSICDRKFSQSSSVTTHMRTHSGERPYRCRLCKKAFSDSSTLTKHLRIHSGEKPYQCKLCHLRFSQSGNLNRHMRIHAQTGR